jgi:hypothetical protein
MKIHDPCVEGLFLLSLIAGFCATLLLDGYNIASEIKQHILFTDDLVDSHYFLFAFADIKMF